MFAKKAFSFCLLNKISTSEINIKSILERNEFGKKKGMFLEWNELSKQDRESVGRIKLDK